MLSWIFPVLINVAFVTFLERKILGLSQFRRGPNKVSLMGIAQPAADAVKLFLKEMAIPYMSNLLLYSASPILGLTISLWLWASPPVLFSSGSNLGMLLIFTVMSLGVYPLFLAGWASNSKFAQLGALRAVAQTISYEISLSLVLFSVLVLDQSLSNSWAILSPTHDMSLVFPLLALWVITCVAETNRTPFDFAEGESELVSGFNVEYGASAFAIIFMAEYAMILFFSGLTISLFFKAPQAGLVWESLTVGLAGVWIWLRSTFPRYRYDKLLNLAWKSLLPQTMGLSALYSALAF